MKRVSANITHCDCMDVVFGERGSANLVGEVRLLHKLIALDDLWSFVSDDPLWIVAGDT